MKLKLQTVLDTKINKSTLEIIIRIMILEKENLGTIHFVRLISKQSKSNLCLIIKS